MVGIAQPESNDLLANACISKKQINVAAWRFAARPGISKRIGDNRQRAKADCQTELSERQSMRSGSMQIAAGGKPRKTAAAGIDQLFNKSNVILPLRQSTKPAGIEEEPTESERVVRRPVSVLTQCRQRRESLR